MDPVKGAAKDVGGQLAHQAGALGNVEEAIGVEQSLGGVLPADERLDAGDRASARVRFGLVVEDQFTVLQSVPELADQSQPVAGS